ncbi:aldehyde dehydrogenase family protein, partial [Mycolicibacterium sphagni]|nr:aldehyde dehydrogenase family protein [Mycolicibacterium sphagni]
SGPRTSAGPTGLPSVWSPVRSPSTARWSSTTRNCQMVFDHSMPFGGWKQSGWGYEWGREGVEAFLQTKSVYAQL